MSEPELPWAVTEIDVGKASHGYFIATFHNPRSAKLRITGALVGPAGERLPFSWVQNIEPDWLWVGYHYELPLVRMRQSPGVWTIELSLDGQPAGRYSVLAGDERALARLRGKPVDTAATRRARGANVGTLELRAPPETRVRVNERDHQLDARGVLRIDLPPETYTVVATKDGFLPARNSIRIVAGESLAHEIALAPAIAPVVAVVAPALDTPLTAEEIRLTLEVQSPYRVVDVRGGLESDTATSLSLPLSAVGQPFNVELPIRLADGQNRVRMEVVDEHGGRTERTVVVTRQSVTTGPYVVRHAYFTTSTVRGWVGMTDRELPPGTEEFDPSQHGEIRFWLVMNNPGHNFIARAVLKRPDGSTQTEFTLGPYFWEERQRSWTWHAHWRVLWPQQLRAWPGEWTLEVFVDSEPLGTYRLRVLAETVAIDPRQPTITVTTAVDQLIRDARTIVRVEVHGPYRPKWIRVAGFASTTPEAGSSEPWVFETGVPLDEGENQFVVETEDEHDRRASTTIVLRRESLVALESSSMTTSAAPPAISDATPPAIAAVPRPPAAPSPPPPAAKAPRDPAPPRIVLNYPSHQAKLEREQILIAGLVTDALAVDRAQLTLNGVNVPLTRDAATTAKGFPIRASVKLQPGENIIEITATNRAGDVAQLVHVVTLVLPATAAPMPATGDRWAVIVGIGRYASRTVPPLRYAVADAEAIHRVLTGPGGFKKENIVLLTDSSERKPTLRNIKWALGTFLARQAKKDDTVLIFFAGHGAPEVDPRGLERDGLAKYLIPSDADPEDLYSTALPMDEIHTIFTRIEAERMVVLLDSCYSGAAGGRTFASRRLRTRDISVDDLFLERLTRAKGRVILTASRPSEVSIELEELGHGLFTYHVVEGLKGAADLNRDGIVTLQELYEHVADQVGRKSRAVGGNQHPVMKGEVEGIFPLVRLRTR